MGFLDTALKVAGVVAPAVIGGVVQQRAGREAEQLTERGAQEQADIEALNRLFAREQFEKQIARQEPFRQAGLAALPQLIQAIQAGGGDVSALPSTQFQSQAVSEVIGEQAPEFIREEALQNIRATESQRNLGRLADLVNIGLGGAGTAAGSTVNLGSTLATSLGRSGAAQEAGLQQAAAMRENRRNQLIQGLAGLPAFAVQTLPLFQQQQPISPFTTTANPLGLTPGQGL